MAKVLDLFAEKRKREIEEKAELLDRVPEVVNDGYGYDFSEVMKNNQQKEQKLKQQRDKYNNNVKSSYRLTPKKKN